MLKNTSLKTIFSGSVWGILAKIISAGIQFITIPLLIGYYGKLDYGLIALAYSLNAYLRLVDLGMNTGLIRYLSIWVSKDETKNIVKASQTSVLFYTFIGLVNALVFIGLGYFSQGIFKLEHEQALVFSWLMYILAASAVINWFLYVVNQLLTAFDEIAWINRVTILASLLNLCTAYLAVKLELSIPKYFFIYTLGFLMVIPLNILRLRKTGIPVSQLLSPKWDKHIFKTIIGYSLSIFAMGIFQFSANNLRPILLGAFGNQGVGIVTEYRIIETISMLIIAFGGVFLQVLLPVSAKSYALSDQKRIEQIIYGGTKYVTIFLSLVIFGLVINANELLELYVGKEFTHLSVWLIIWLITLFSMHNTPVSSLILSVGKIKPLVYSSAVACIVSLALTAVLAPKLSVGAAVIAYLIYILIQVSFSYVYYIPRILKLNGKRIFLNSFLPSLIGGATIAALVYYFVGYSMNKEYSLVVVILIKSTIFAIAFFVYSFFVIVKKEEITHLRNLILHKIR